MTHESSPDNPPVLTGDAHTDGDQHHEVLLDGARQLTSNIIQIHEAHGAQAVGEYMSSLLRDEDGTAPVAEKTAAFHLLAGEQQAVLDAEVRTQGVRMLDMLGNGNNAARESLLVSNQKAQTWKTRFVPGFRLAVDPVLNRGAHHLVIAGAHEAYAKNAGATSKVVTDHFKTASTWRDGQHETISGFQAATEATMAKQLRLAKTGQALHNGETETGDLSTDIDEPIITATVDKLMLVAKTAAQAGESPQDAVAGILETQLASSPVRSSAVLTEFIKNYMPPVDSRLAAVKNEHDQQFTKRITGFVNDAGRYSDARRPADMAEVVHYQRRNAAAIEALAGTIIDRTNLAFTTADQKYKDFNASFKS